MVNLSKTFGKLTMPLLVLLVISFFSLPALGQPWLGSGTAEDPYQIWTAADMQAIGADSAYWDKHFKLMANIDLTGFTGTSFNIIGIGYYNPFSGVFDGNGHTISNFTYTSTGTSYIGLFGFVKGENAVIKDLGLIDPDVDAGKRWYVGSLVGLLSDGTITNCYVEGGNVSGDGRVGGLVGYNRGTMSNCYSTGSVSGNSSVGGLVGINSGGTISNCYSGCDVSGTGCCTGGLVGGNYGTISNCYASGDVSGDWAVGGLAGMNEGIISNCYSTASVMGITNVGGLVGYNEDSTVSNSFWDTQTSGHITSAGGTGKTTAEMQMQVTFTDVGWDFDTPVWTIDEGVDYPRLWWELVPVLHAEPQITFGTTNTITWEPVPRANDYYAECAEDANFTSIVYNSGWITETSYEFTDLELGQRYWYSVKARNIAGVETDWSNVESSLQGTLAEAVDVMLDPNSLKNEKMKKALMNKINAVQQMLDAGRYEEALNKLENDILTKMNGCADTGQPDKNDWIITCEGQNQIYPLVIETIEYVRGLMDQ